MARVEGGAVVILTDWPGLKDQIDTRYLSFRFEETNISYEIFAIDGQYIYTAPIYKAGQAPDNQPLYDTYRAEFETYYKYKITDFNATEPVFLTSVDGYSVVLKDGNAPTINDGYGIAVIGIDGSNYRMLKMDVSGRPVMVGAGTAGSPVGGLITIQGDPAGEPIPISGNITASNASVGLNDAAIPGSSTLIAGSDGTNLRSLRVFDGDTGGGTQWILGVGLRKFSGGGSVEFGTSSDPVRTDPTGTTTQPISGTVTANQGGSWTVSGTGDFTVVQPTASNLRAQLASETSTGTAVPSTAVQMGGSDGVNLRPFFTDSSGRQIIIGAAANGAAVAGNPVLVAGSDGTNARSIRTATDGTVRVDPTGTTIQPVSGTVTANQGGAPWSTNQTQINGSAVTVLAAGEQKVAVEGLVADGAAVSGNPVLTAGFDGTNVQTKLTDTSGRQIVVGAAADGAAVTGNPVLMGGQDGTNVQSITTDPVGNQYTVDYGAPSNSLRGVSFGRIIGQANTLQAVRATTYTQQSTNAQRSVSSGSASDTSAGAGARQVLITYYTATMTGPFTETVTLNGTTPVNTSNTNICFIEKMEVVSVGSNLSNVGIISLFVSTGGGGGTIGTISINNIANGRGDNQTIWAHHYVASGITMNLTSFMAGTNTNQGATTFIMNVDPTVTTSAEKMITDSIVFSANTSSVVRNFVVPLRIAGPARLTLYVVPNGSNTPFFGGFNFWEL